MLVAGTHENKQIEIQEKPFGLIGHHHHHHHHKPKLNWTNWNIDNKSLTLKNDKIYHYYLPTISYIQWNLESHSAKKFRPSKVLILLGLDIWLETLHISHQYMTQKKKKNYRRKEETNVENHTKKRSTSCSTHQLWGVESTTALCLFEGPEGGTGTPLGKKLKTKLL